MKLAAFIFCLISTIVMGCLLFPLLWCVPATIAVWHYYNGERNLSVGFKVFILLFVNAIAGILLLCTEDYKYYKHIN